jgi:CRP-like cAMP-binding protein
MAVESLAERIAGHPFMKDVPARHIETLTGCAMEVSFAPGETIFRQGDPANRFYLLEHGKVQLEAVNGVRVPIQTIGAGEVLGWSWLFPPFRWQFDAVALEETKAIFLYGSRLRELCDEDTDLAACLLRATAVVLMDRLQTTRRLLVQRSGQEGERS